MNRCIIIALLLLVGCGEDRLILIDASGPEIDDAHTAGDAGPGDRDGSAPDAGAPDAAPAGDAGLDAEEPDSSGLAPDADTSAAPVPRDVACARIREAFDETGCSADIFWCAWASLDRLPTEAEVSSCTRTVACPGRVCSNGLPGSVESALRNCGTTAEPTCP